MIAVAHDPSLGEGDVAYVDGQLVEGADLATAVYLSLFLDAPAGPDDDVPADASRGGFWFDGFAGDDDVTGSRLWLLRRAKATKDAARRAKEAADEALAWLIRDGLASRVETETEIVELDSRGERAVALSVVLVPPNSRSTRRFGPWLLLQGGEVRDAAS